MVMPTTHELDGSGYAYCSLNHPGSDEDAREWCRLYHRPVMPADPRCAFFVDAGYHHRCEKPRGHAGRCKAGCVEGKGVEF